MTFREFSQLDVRRGCDSLSVDGTCLSSSLGPPRMSPKSQRTPRSHRVPPSRIGGVHPGVDLASHSSAVEVSSAPPTRSNSSGGTWSSVVSGGKTSSFFLIGDSSREAILLTSVVGQVVKFHEFSKLKTLYLIGIYGNKFE